MNPFHQIRCRVVIVSAVLVSLVPAPGIAPWWLFAAEAAEVVTEKPPEQNDPIKLSPAQEKILQVLKEPGRLRFVEVPLSAVAEDVKQRYKIDLRYDDGPLLKVGIASDTPVTLSSRGLSLNNALWLLFRELGLTHVIRGDDLLITTPQEAERIVLSGGINPDQIAMWSGNGKVVRALIYPTLLEFIETPLQDVIDYLGDLHQIPIRLDGRALHKVGARSNTPVTCNMKGITLNSGLRLVLDEIGLTHVVSHAVLLITTPQERDRLVQRVAFEPDDLRYSTGNKQVLAALTENTKIEFIQVPLQDAVDHLEDLHGIPIKLDRRAIRKAGMKLDASVTGDIQGATLHNALNTILGKIGLAHVVHHEVLLITTPAESRRRLLCGALLPTDSKTAEAVATANAVAAALKKPVTVSCREKPLSELVDILKQQSGAEIRIDDWGLATAGRKRDFPCTIAVKNLPLQSVLQQLLHGAQLGYMVEDNLVVITAREISSRLRDGSPDNVAHNLKRMGAMLDYGTDSSAPYIAGVCFYVDRGHVTDDVFEDFKTLSRLRRLDLGGTRVTDAALVHLSNFPELLELDLNRITDAGLEHVAALKQLRHLNLERARVTDDGLKHLQGLTELRELYLSHTNVTDAGLRYLANLEHLEALELVQTKVTGAGLEHIAGHKKLRRLELTGPAVSGAALEHLADCTRLKLLRLEGPGVTDASLEHVRRLTQLRLLTLVCPRVSDAGLKHLAGLSQLEWLDLSQTQITGVGLSHLRSPQLKRLIVSNSQVNDAGLAHLKGLTSVRVLGLGNTQITDAAVVHLREWWQNVRTATETIDDPFAGGRQSGHLIVRDTKFTLAAAKVLARESPGLQVIQ